MRKIIAAILAGMALLACRCHAQTTNSFLPGLSSSVTNVIFIPYLKYDVNEHQIGYGGAALYKVSENFWAGARVDRINGQQTTAGVQAQLQDTITWHGLTVTPFLETSVGLGSSALYGSAGPGIYFNLYSHGWVIAGDHVLLTIGVAADYEHVINGSQNSNQLNAGPGFHFSF